MTDREQQILRLIEKNPMVSQKEIADTLGIQRSSVGVHILNLVKKGALLGKGYVINHPRSVLVIGGANMDITGMPETKLCGGDSAPGFIRYSPGGVGRNIAENLGRMGVSTRLITAVGDDENGRRLIAGCNEVGVSTEGSFVSHTYATSTYLSLNESSGEMVYALSDMSVVNELTPEHLKKQSYLIKEAACIVLDANLTEESITYLFSTYPNQVFFVDPVSVTKSRKIKPWLNRIHTIKPNRQEIEVLQAHPFTTGEAGIKALKELGVKNPYVSCGKEGVYYSDGEGVHVYSNEVVEVINVSGAGDAYMAGLVYAYLKKIPVSQSVKIAQYAAEIALRSSDTVSSEMTSTVMESFIETQI